MSRINRTGKAAAARLVLTVSLFGLAGCFASGDRGIVASWYVVDSDPKMPRPGAKPALEDSEGRVEDIYLAVVNRGRRTTNLYGLFMNGKPLPAFTALRPSGYYSLVRGQVLLLPTGIFTRDQTGIYTGGSPCRLPVSVAVKTNNKKRPRPIKLIGSMPGALPSEWLDDCLN